VDYYIYENHRLNVNFVGDFLILQIKKK